MGQIDRNINLGSLGSATDGTVVDLAGRSLHNAELIVYGTFSLTWRCMVSHDGTNFVPAKDINGNVLSAIAGTVEECRVIAGDAAKVRFDATAWTSGTINARLQPLA